MSTRAAKGCRSVSSLGDVELAAGQSANRPGAGQALFPWRYPARCGGSLSRLRRPNHHAVVSAAVSFGSCTRVCLEIRRAFPTIAPYPPKSKVIGTLHATADSPTIMCSSNPYMVSSLFNTSLTPDVSLTNQYDPNKESQSDEHLT